MSDSGQRDRGGFEPTKDAFVKTSGSYCEGEHCLLNCRNWQGRLTFASAQGLFHDSKPGGGGRGGGSSDISFW
jgi:hypothetical protein